MDAQCEVTRTDRHVQIDSAITELRTVIEYADNLINRINGNDSPPVDSNKLSTTPTLNGVLTDASDEIRNIKSALQGRLDDIANLIF